MSDYQEHLQGLKDRTRKYALRIISLYTSLDKSEEVSRVIGRQILRSGTSVGAQFREGCRAKSDPDLISKLQGSIQELEESIYWMELMIDTEIFKKEKLEPLMQESEELIAIFITIINKLKK